MDGGDVDAGPCWGSAGGGWRGAFAVDVDAAIIRGGGEEGPVARMCPGHAPYCAFVPAGIQMLDSMLATLPWNDRIGGS